MDLNTPARYAHNDYLQALAETGIAGEVKIGDKQQV
jgi:O-antigen ligase